MNKPLLLPTPSLKPLTNANYHILYTRVILIIPIIYYNIYIYYVMLFIYILYDV